jgi:hypothetical protein
LSAHQPRVAQRLPLQGADLVLLALGSPPGGPASNNALLVVRCDGPLAPDRVTASLERLLDVCPWPAARLRRPFPWGKLHWAAGRRATLAPPPVRRCAVATPAAFHQAVGAELNAAIDPRREPPLRFLILEGAAAGAPDALVMTWFHPLMDPRGAQNLLLHLGHLDEHPGEVPWNGQVPAFTSAPEPRPFRERGRLARQSLAYMRSMSQGPSAGPGDGRAAPVRFRQERFVERAAPNGDDRATRDIWWRLAVVGKAMGEIWARRGLPDLPFRLPIAVDLRPKGEPGPSFGNMLAFHFARFRPSETADIPRLASALRAQMADALRQGHIEANAVAMTFLEYRPLSMIRSAVRSIPGGDAFSFNCADVAEFPTGLARCFGRRVLNAYHVPAVPSRPGIGVFFNRCAGRHNLVVAWIDGVLDEEDVSRIVETVREEMGWLATA